MDNWYVRTNLAYYRQQDLLRDREQVRLIRQCQPPTWLEAGRWVAALLVGSFATGVAATLFAGQLLR